MATKSASSWSPFQPINPAVCRTRLTAGLLAKAERGELALTLPIGLIRDPSGVVVKDPDKAVQERLGLVFEMFLKFRTAERS